MWNRRGEERRGRVFELYMQGSSRCTRISVSCQQRMWRAQRTRGMREEFNEKINWGRRTLLNVGKYYVCLSRVMHKHRKLCTYPHLLCFTYNLR